MNDEQKELYEEWKRLEVSTSITTEIGSKKGHYTPHIPQKPDDILKLEPIQNRVWNELKEFLTQEERTNLGMYLNKSLEEIFDLNK